MVCSSPVTVEREFWWIILDESKLGNYCGATSRLNHRKHFCHRQLFDLFFLSTCWVYHTLISLFLLKGRKVDALCTELILDNNRSEANADILWLSGIFFSTTGTLTLYRILSICSIWLYLFITSSLMDQRLPHVVFHDVFVHSTWAERMKLMQLFCSPLIVLALLGVCRAASAGCWDGAHAEPAPEQRRGLRKCSESLRGLCLSQWQAFPVQSWGHLHLQRESGVLDRLWWGNWLYLNKNVPNLNIIVRCKSDLLILMIPFDLY